LPRLILFSGGFGGVVLCGIFWEVPMTTRGVSSELFRKVMGSFPTGVTVITAEREPWQVHGMTANSLTSVSLDPLLLLVCIDQDARLLSYMKAQMRFGVSILKDTEDEARLGVKFQWTETGIPILQDGLAHIACNVVAQYTSGDHTIFVGEVESLELQEGEPLLYHRGKYSGLQG
jgi:flavin reductase (DIM6/NTAB) family NADH-FMN oxidoreductase RutF